MDLIIKTEVIGAAPVQTVNARDLHASLGVRKDFTDWIKAQIKRALLTENTDYVVSLQKGVNPQGGRPTDEYHLTIEAGKNIAMLTGTAKGKEVRQYFIECERLAKAGPVVKDPVLAAHIATLMRLDVVQQEQQRQGAELARLGESMAVIEARTQPENKHFTVMGYANLVGQKLDFGTASKLGRKCAELSRAQGMVIGDVSDPRFGKVHSYHESVLQSVLLA